MKQVAAEAPHRIGFHAWVQWCFDLQLAAASADVRRIADMPVGVDPGGFDAWDWQEQLALGASIGVPADRFSVQGQDWGMPPFVPHRLREAGYRPFIETVRAQLRHAGGLRIDHVLGLFRLWWVPKGMTDGAYVRQPTDELLEIVALESHRAGAIVIGEDLGTVPTGVRNELRRRRMLSTRLALFEREPPDRYPRLALAGVTTHDLPTVAGLLTGSDLDDQAAAGVSPDPDGLAKLRDRLLAAAGVGEGAELEDVVLGLHRGAGRLAVGAGRRHARGCAADGAATEHARHAAGPAAELVDPAAGAGRGSRRRRPRAVADARPAPVARVLAGRVLHAALRGLRAPGGRRSPSGSPRGRPGRPRSVPPRPGRSRARSPPAGRPIG